MRRNSKRRNIHTPAIILLLFFVVFFLILFKSDFFSIKTISVAGQDLECATQNQIKDQSHFFGENFFMLNTTNSTNDIKNKFICIRGVTVTKALPNKIKIDVASRKPIAKVIKLQNDEASSAALLENIATPSAKESQDLYLMDDEGVIFSRKINNLDLPSLFIYDPNLSLGKKITDQFSENRLKILEKVKTFGLYVDSSALINNDFILFAYPRVIFRLDSTVDAQIASLQLILEKAKIDANMVEFIDLRFDKPIIKIAPKKNG